MTEQLTSKQWVEVVDHMRSIAKAIYNQNAFRSCALDDLADQVERLARAAAEPVAPSSPPADPDPEPSRADKLRAALKPAGVKVNVLGEADGSAACQHCETWKRTLEATEANRKHLELRVDELEDREAEPPPAARDYSVMDVEDEYREQQIANRDEAIERLEQQKENLLNALEAKQARIDALMLEYCPGEMSASQRAAWSASQERASVPPAASQVEEVLCAGVVVSSPHDRRITLRFETDEQFRAAEVLIGIADCQMIDTAVTKGDADG